ncbi:MAG: glycosyl hydrolase [Bacteroides xylanisolvens]
MKYIIGSLCFVWVTINAVAQVSETCFVNPPCDARPNTYWEWMNGNIDKEGLTKDLEYMKRANYGGAMIFDAGVGIPRGSVDYNSSQWKEAVLHAVKEAERLGLGLSIHNSPGYSGTGGPWVPVECSMKQLVWTEVFASVDRKRMLEVNLPRPYSKMGFYKDAAVLAYPSLPSEGVLFHSLVNRITLNGKTIDKEMLADNNLDTQFRMEEKQSLLIELNEAFTVQAATIYRGDREAPLDPHDGPRDYSPALSLEVSDDGINFVYIGRFNCPPLRAMDPPGTLSFAPVKARYFRITTDRGTNLAEVDFHSSPRLENYAAKMNYVNAPVSLKDSQQEVTEFIQSEQVVNLTNKVDINGHLKWKAPEGKWTIVRIGYTTTGEVVAAAPESGIGLDCDKFSKKALDKHFDLFVDPLLDILKPWCGTTLETLVIDSWEAGKQNWTEDLPAYFKKKCGYDIMSYLLAVTGRIVGSVNNTERFLWDFRRTHTDMFLENYVEHFKERIGRYGLKYAGEAYGDGNFESVEMAARQDYPMSEFWTHYVYGNISTTMLASSTGHVWNRQLIACECYTGTPFNSKFTEHPYGMKALGDYIMTAGVNRFVYHATTHQPYTGDQFGNLMTMGPFGTHLDRTSTWADQFAALNLYNARCAYMLQRGKYVADVLYLKNEAISNGVNNYNVTYPATPYGYRWDITGVEALQQRLSVKDGRIVLPDGMNYSLLVVTPMERTSPETLKRIIELVEQGMKVMLVGDKPIGYLGLNTQKNKEVRELADKLWNATTLGKGYVYHKGELGDILLKYENIQPDFSFITKNIDAQVHFIHRRVNGDEIYFITNHRRRPEQLTVTCRVSGKVPQLWNAETGCTGIPITYEEQGGTTKFNLHLQESGSIFVVFRSGVGKSTEIVDVVPEPTIIHTRKSGKVYKQGFDFRSTFTISLWAKPETFALSGRGFLIYPGYGKGNVSQVGISMGQNGVSIYECNKNKQLVLESKKPIQGWTHVGLIYKEGVPTLYLNGKQVATGQKSIYDCCPSLDIAMEEEQYIASFEGDQTKTEVYDYVLSEQELENIVALGLPLSRHEGREWKLLDEEWTVQFPEWSKAPAEIMLPKLQSLHTHSDFNVKHFSGTATYVKKFTLTSKELETIKGKQLSLNLGRVENIAEVSINGSDFRLLWKAPYWIDVTGKLKVGENKVVIKVTNLYPNRMIGDEYLFERYEYDEYGSMRKLPEWYLKGEYNQRERVLFVPWKYYHKDDPLLESGLLGSVRLYMEQ